MPFCNLFIERLSYMWQVCFITHNYNVCSELTGTWTRIVPVYQQAGDILHVISAPVTRVCWPLSPTHSLTPLHCTMTSSSNVQLQRKHTQIIKHKTSLQSKWSSFIYTVSVSQNTVANNDVPCFACRLTISLFSSTSRNSARLSAASMLSLQLCSMFCFASWTVFIYTPTSDACHLKHKHIQCVHHKKYHQY